MKRNIGKLIVSIVVGMILTHQMPVYATESVSNNNLEINNDILLETDSSIVIDMHMQPAKRMPMEKAVYDNPRNSYSSTKSPAQITKQGGFYFIADTFHNQVIYSSRLETPVKDWKVVNSKVSGPHAISSDGKYYLIADTENDSVLVYEWNRGGLRLTQKFENMGVRPHYIDYDVTTDSFFVWSSMTCEMYILAKDATGTLCIKEIRKIKELTGHYIRSFTINGDYILFPSGTNKQILITDKESLQILGRFLVPDEVSGMACIKIIGSYFYMTVSSDDKFDQSHAAIIRTKDLSKLILGEYEDISSQFPHIQIPYYIEYMQNAYYMTNHGNSHSVFKFNVINDEIKNVRAMQY